MEVTKQVKEILEPLGFEADPFKIGWYNEVVGDIFRLPYDNNTLAFSVLSTPAMFDKAFKPYICDTDFIEGKDVLDGCVRKCLRYVEEAFPAEDIEVIETYDLQHNRRPKVLVQSAAHVSGSSYYYRRTDVKDDPWKPEQKVAGVCVHPKYGGWMGLRGVVIFRSIQFPDLQQKSPVDCVPSQNHRIDLLNKFNFHWKDRTYRDIIEVEQSYSQEQTEFFETPPRERGKLIDKIRMEVFKKNRTEINDK